MQVWREYIYALKVRVRFEMLLGYLIRGGLEDWDIKGTGSASGSLTKEDGYDIYDCYDGSCKSQSVRWGG